jgi:phasin family protein
MSIFNKIAATRESLTARARAYGDTAVAAARQSTLRAAERMAGAPSRVRTLATAGQRLSTLSNRCIEQMIDQQAHTIEGLIETGVERLRNAAQAKTLRSLIDNQKTLWTRGRGQLRKDLRKTWQIASDSGRELRDLTRETHAAFARNTQVPATRGKVTRVKKAAAARKRKPAR